MLDRVGAETVEFMQILTYDTEYGNHLESYLNCLVLSPESIDWETPAQLTRWILLPACFILTFLFLYDFICSVRPPFPLTIPCSAFPLPDAPLLFYHRYRIILIVTCPRLAKWPASPVIHNLRHREHYAASRGAYVMTEIRGNHRNAWDQQKTYTHKLLSSWVI